MKRRFFAALVLLFGLTAALSGCSAPKPAEEDLMASIPTLTLWIGERSASIPTYGYSWTREVGAGGQSVGVDTAHPLQVVEDLTGVSVPTGSTIGLGFSLLPDSVAITCWGVDQAGDPGAEGQDLESSFSNGLFYFTPPESGQELVLWVQGNWTSYDDVSGSVSYAFVLSQN